MSKTRRLSKIFGGDGKSITLAIDHYFFTKGTDGIDEAIEMIPELAELGLDAVLVTPGIASIYEEQLSRVALILRADISSDIFNPMVPGVHGLLSIEEAVKIGADGVICMTFPGSAFEYTTHKFTAELSAQSKLWNMPLVVETLPYSYPVTSPESSSIEAISSAARIGTELGADIIKTRLTGVPEDSLIIKKAMKPILVLGGPKSESHQDFFGFIEHCMKVGAKGIAVGRNVWKDKHPKQMIAALNHIVHCNGTAAEANDIYIGKEL